MAYSNRLLRRRPRIERRVLALLRGETDPLLDGHDVNAFVRLRHLARRKDWSFMKRKCLTSETTN